MSIWQSSNLETMPNLLNSSSQDWAATLLSQMRFGADFVLRLIEVPWSRLEFAPNRMQKLNGWISWHAGRTGRAVKGEMFLPAVQI